MWLTLTLLALAAFFLSCIDQVKRLNFDTACLIKPACLQLVRERKECCPLQSSLKQELTGM